MQARLSLLAAAGVLASVVAGKAPVSGGREGRGLVPIAQELPDGPGKELLPKLCAGCHDLMFTVSTRETTEGWARIVNDMRAKGADGTDADFDVVVAYLAANFGKK